MADRTTANERFGELRNVDRGQDASVNIEVLKRVLQHDRVHYGREHPDVIGG